MCGENTKVVVCASSMGAVSYAYCKECLEDGLEPYGSMVAYISCAGRFPEEINESYVNIVRNILNKFDISEEKFIEDVNQSINDMDEYFSKRE